MCKRLIIVSLLIVMTIALVPIGDALAATPSDPDITVLQCSIGVEFNADVEGTYEVRIWDDGFVVQSAKASGDIGDRLVFQFQQTAFGVIIGVGLEIVRDGVEVFYTEISEIEGPCNEALRQGCTPSLTEGAVVGQVTQTTTAYWAPSLDAQTDTVLEPGKTWWVLGTDSSGEWYKVLVSCEPVWIPASALGPNSDSVWGGRPLPSNAVK